MRLLPSDPDINTLVDRIKGAEIDLSPDFQRGEVWPQSKQQKLIDSILRDWHIPPIHVIEGAGGRVSVLDGQQRLASIRDFVDGVFAVDGAIEPFEARISRLDGRHFSELPPTVKKRFLRFPIRLFTIVDYKSAEPGELFYRLNQPTSLTPAEQRNAFFGSARSQTKELVRIATGDGGAGVFGFSNARMAYDDAITRAIFLLNNRTLRQKVTAAGLADKFRSDTPFSNSAVKRLQQSIEIIAGAQDKVEERIKLNKATAESWLVFLASARQILATTKSASVLSEFFIEMESRLFKLRRSDLEVALSRKLGRRTVNAAIDAYVNRATSRVADVSSVVLRDMVLWMFFFEFASQFGVRFKTLGRSHKRLRDLIRRGEVSAKDIDQLADRIAWGEVL